MFNFGNSEYARSALIKSLYWWKMCAASSATAFMGASEIIYGDNYDLDGNLLFLSVELSFLERTGVSYC
jgi:hypothetical protein